MQFTISILCAVATFVLMYDNQKIVSASVLPSNEHRRTVRETGKYTTKYDNIDVDRILSSKRLLQNYMNCLLDKGPCTAEGKELKVYLPEALATECAKCSDVQKRLAGKVLSHLLQNHRSYWDALIAKYDPEGNFRKKYEVDEDEYHDED